MTSRPASGLLAYLEQIPDPRGRQGLRHPLSAMLAAVVCAVLSGYGSYDAIAQWIHGQEASLWHRLGFRRRPPTAAGFRKVLMAVCPQAVETALWRWVTEGLGLALEEELQAITLDGKVLRGTRGRHQRAWQVLAALDQRTGCVLSQTPIDAATNESKTALELLESMVLKGKVIVGDAAYCQRELCQTIVDKEGDYLVLVKDNQPALHHAVEQAFVIPRAFSPLPTALSGVGTPGGADEGQESWAAGDPHTDFHDGRSGDAPLAGSKTDAATGADRHGPR